MNQLDTMGLAPHVIRHLKIYHMNKPGILEHDS